MTVALASAWRPRGELPRFERLLPQLQAVYTSLALTLPPDVEPALVAALDRMPGVQAAVTSGWPTGRYLALQQAQASDADAIHYVDFDRLLRWVEIRPQEWRETVASVCQADYLVIGRTPAAYATHPRALVETEAVSNRVVSFLIGQEVDASAGSKGFSRQAARFIIACCRPGHALGTDGEWTVVLHRAGFRVEALRVDGLDWESADRYENAAVGQGLQQQAAASYDADPANWAHRVQVADEIIACALDAACRELPRQEDILDRPVGPDAPPESDFRL